MVVGWVLGTFLFVYFLAAPRIQQLRKSDPRKGFGAGPIPANTLYAEPQTLFADPLSSQSASSSNLMTTGVNHDTLLMVGWLDLSKGPRAVHVPDMNARYYSAQFTYPSDGPISLMLARTPPARARATTSSPVPSTAGNRADSLPEQCSARYRSRVRGERQRAPGRLCPCMQLTPLSQQ